MMRLLTSDELASLPLTETYLHEHEESLRDREGGRMDHDRWYAFGRTQSLGAHDHAKVGVPRLCERLRASVDPRGQIYLDNVDVNGILMKQGGPSAWMLAVLLNSRLLDFIFRRGSVPFRGAFFSANKQFIAPLPIRVAATEEASTLDELGRRLHETAAAISGERESFLGWLGDVLGTRVRELAGATTLLQYEEHQVADLIEVLHTNRARLVHDPTSRSFREQLESERMTSLDRLSALTQTLASDESAANELVYDLYRLPRRQREVVDADSA